MANISKLIFSKGNQMTLLTDDDIRRLIVDDSFTFDDLTFAQAVEQLVLERAIAICKRNKDWASVDGIRAMKNQGK
jgi:hypothetical protein